MNELFFKASAENIGTRIDKFLADSDSDLSRSAIQKLIDDKQILCNGKPVSKNYKLKDNDEITVIVPEPVELDVIAQDISLEIVYEDDDLLVVNKPAGLVVHPGCGNYTGTLVNALAWHLKDDSDFDANDPEVGLVHRIDKDTSGLLVIAKTAIAKTRLGVQFFNKTTSRLYNALVWGDFDEMTGRIEGNIGRDPKDRLKMAVFDPQSDQGKNAVTHWRVLRRYGFVTLVECRLETGRTHQIRAHMKHIGHPLFNDERYGGDQILRGTRESSYMQFVKRCFEACPRQALHAKTLGFEHPTTRKQMHFDSPWAPDFQQLIDLWEEFVKQN